MPDLSPAPVTAVIPAYNSEEYLADALASVHAQTRPVSELLVVDDGSSDDTAGTARAANARLIQHDRNRGVSAARNTGIRAARHDWIAFLDADDRWKPEKIEVQWTVVSAYQEVEVVFTDREHFSDDEVLRATYLPSWGPYRNMPKDPLTEDVYRCPRQPLSRATYQGLFIKQSTLLARRDLLLEIGMFDENLQACEDVEFSLRMLCHTDPVVVERPLLSYRIRSDSLSSNSAAMDLGRVYIADKIERSSGLYPEGAREHYTSWRPDCLRRAAVVLMHDGNFKKARSLLWRSIWERPCLRTLAALATALGGRPLHRFLLLLKRRFQLPGLR